MPIEYHATTPKLTPDQNGNKNYGIAPEELIKKLQNIYDGYFHLTSPFISTNNNENNAITVHNPELSFSEQQPLSRSEKMFLRSAITQLEQLWELYQTMMQSIYVWLAKGTNSKTEFTQRSKEPWVYARDKNLPALFSDCKLEKLGELSKLFFFPYQTLEIPNIKDQNNQPFKQIDAQLGALFMESRENVYTILGYYCKREMQALLKKLSTQVLQAGNSKLYTIFSSVVTQDRLSHPQYVPLYTYVEVRDGIFNKIETAIQKTELPDEEKDLSYDLLSMLAKIDTQKNPKNRDLCNDGERLNALCSELLRFIQHNIVKEKNSNPSSCDILLVNLLFTLDKMTAALRRIDVDQKDNILQRAAEVIQKNPDHFDLESFEIIVQIKKTAESETSFLQEKFNEHIKNSTVTNSPNTKIQTAKSKLDAETSALLTKEFSQTEVKTLASFRNQLLASVNAEQPLTLPSKTPSLSASAIDE